MIATVEKAAVWFEERAKNTPMPGTRGMFEIAAAAIHEKANGATVQQWISVKDRLPEEPLQTVLITNGRSVCVGVYSVVYEEFGVMCGRGQEKRFGVTHWMPLPQPPKGE